MVKLTNPHYHLTWSGKPINISLNMETVFNLLETDDMLNITIADHRFDNFHPVLKASFNKMTYFKKFKE